MKPLVSKSLLTVIVSAGTVALFAFLGQLAFGIFNDTATILDDINHGRTPSKTSVISDSDLARLQGIPAEVAKLQSK